ncbi:MAG: IMP dehydrogenase [Elusimicrobiota bacterium]
MLKDEGITFDDVLLVPQKTSLTSRSQASTKTKLTRNIDLNIPIVSSNMDTVTESKMAIAMARLGGIGIVHRYMSIEEEVRQVSRVKRSESVVIDEPYTITPRQTVQAAMNLMRQVGVSSLIVVSSGKKIAGILTSRDVVFVQQPLKVTVADVMTPKERLHTAKAGVSEEQARKILEQHRIEKLPLINAAGEVAGLITVKDIIEKKTLFPNAVKDSKGKLLVGAAIGVKGDYLERAQELSRAGCDVLVLDIAHGHADYAIDAIKRIKRSLGSRCELIAGNVATYQGAKDLARAGADAVKAGIGPGSICITRIVAGAGVPQVTCLAECCKVMTQMGVPIISDGGIRTSGDVAKALAAGASSVMIGSRLAGTEESPGATIVRDGIKYKVCRGMASLGAALGRADRSGEQIADDDVGEVVAEGVEALVPYRGSVSEIVHQLTGGLCSGMSYCGAKTIPELWKKAVFMRITNASVTESHPHDLERV